MHVNTGSSLLLVQKKDNYAKKDKRHCLRLNHGDHEFRRRLSAEGAKQKSNSRWKSDLGHVGIWPDMYEIWNYLANQETYVNIGSSLLLVQKTDNYAKMINDIASVSCMRSRVQTEDEHRRREAGVERSMKIRSRLWRYIWVTGYGMVFGIISRIKARSATNEVPKYRSQ